MTFRRAFAADLRWRAADLAAHGVLAWALPGPWWLQFVPDLAVPALWAWSMVTDRFVPDDAAPLRVHRWLHLRCGPAWAWTWVAALAAACMAQPAMAWHAAGHLAIDGVTHGERWR